MMFRPYWDAERLRNSPRIQILRESKKARERKRVVSYAKKMSRKHGMKGNTKSVTDFKLTGRYSNDLKLSSLPPDTEVYISMYWGGAD